jgi:hypothetical protein
MMIKQNKITKLMSQKLKISHWIQNKKTIIKKYKMIMISSSKTFKIKLNS